MFAKCAVLMPLNTKSNFLYVLTFFGSVSDSEEGGVEGSGGGCCSQVWKSEDIWWMEGQLQRND